MLSGIAPVGENSAGAFHFMVPGRYCLSFVSVVLSCCPKSDDFFSYYNRIGDM